MVDPTPREMAAMKKAGQIAGEYIESLGRTDLMTWSVEEFITLVTVIVGTFLEAKVQLDKEDKWDDVPF
ncbi:MAG: hypothetical protein HQL74_08150 [Magnetococcales bacterium]|nr:hypothetical protein [Magnetococcales bacterium]